MRRSSLERLKTPPIQSPPLLGGRDFVANALAYGKSEKAAECLRKDRGPLLALYDFPAQHWKHLRTSDEIDKQFLRQRATNPIENTFATLRHRATRSKGCLSNRTALASVQAGRRCAQDLASP